MGIAWFIFGAIAFLTIVGIPWGRASFVMGKFAFFPFGKEAISRKDLKNSKDMGTGFLGTIGNIIWFISFGFLLSLGHLLSALICFVTLIGIPFGLQHLKLAGISLAPVGKTIVPKEVVKVVATGKAQDFIDAQRSKT